MPQAEVWPKDQSAGCQSERSVEFGSGHRRYGSASPHRVRISSVTAGCSTFLAPHQFGIVSCRGVPIAERLIVLQLRQ